MGAPRSGEEDVLLTPGNTELVERVNQCVSALRLECNVQVGRSHGAGRRVAQSLPVLRNGTPRVFRAYAMGGAATQDDYELSYYDPIITDIPETAYGYIGSGMEPDGKLNLVLVLEDGYDRKALHGIIVPPDTLPKAALDVLTPGIWPSW